MSSTAVEAECSGVNMSDPAAQALQPRLLQAQSGGSAGSSSASTGSGSGNSDPARPGLSQQQRASQKKAQVRAFPRAKKLEKLGVFSACKVANAASQSSPSLKKHFSVLLAFVHVRQHIIKTNGWCKNIIYST